MAGRQMPRTVAVEKMANATLQRALLGLSAPKPLPRGYYGYTYTFGRDMSPVGTYPSGSHVGQRLVSGPGPRLVHDALRALLRGCQGTTSRHQVQASRDRWTVPTRTPWTPRTPCQRSQVGPCSHGVEMRPSLPLATPRLGEEAALARMRHTPPPQPSSILAIRPTACLARRRAVRLGADRRGLVASRLVCAPLARVRWHGLETRSSRYVTRGRPAADNALILR